MPRIQQSGNILVFILVAIVLLGLLTAMLVRSGGSSNETGGYEQRSIQISDILKYAAGIEQAVTQLRQRGCSENQISFENAVVSGYSNTNAPADESCHIFETPGAGKPYKTPDDRWLDGAASALTNYGTWVVSPANELQDIGTTAAASSSVDLILMLPFISQDLCAQINARLGIATSLPQDSGQMDYAAKFTGSFAYLQTIASASTNGKKAFCINGNQDNASADISPYYFFISVLKPR